MRDERARAREIERRKKNEPGRNEGNGKTQL